MSITGAGRKVISIMLGAAKADIPDVGAKQPDSGSVADFFDWLVTGLPTLQSVAPQHG